MKKQPVSPTDSAGRSRIFVITVRQPWAWAIIFGGKDIENRTYPLAPSRLLIHAGKTVDPAGVRFLKDHGIDIPPDAYHGGVIIGSVDVVISKRDSSGSIWAQPGKWHWYLENPISAYPTIPARGQPSLWRPPTGWERSFRTVGKQ